MTANGAVQAISRAMSRLVLSQPWFAALALRLAIVADDSIPTACVDGVTLRYNPEWFAALIPKFQEGVIAHEVMHCSCLHMTRRGGRDQQTWNMACDHVINLELLEAGFKLPDGCLADPRFKGKCAEEVYPILKHEEQGKGKGQGGYVDPLGGVQDAPQGGGKGDDSKGKDGKDNAQGDAQGQGQGQSSGDLETDWQVATVQATMMASKAGKLPGSVERATRKARESATDWREVMARYLTLPGDVSWTRPNRRLISRGLYLPGQVKDRPGTVVFMGDGSGSITEELYDRFAAEACMVLGSAGWPEKVIAGIWDTEVHNFDECGDEAEVRQAFKVRAGGGTMAGPIFDRLAAEGVTPTVLFILTDLELGDWATLAAMTPPAYPVVWVAPDWATQALPKGMWGEVAKVPMGQRGY